MTRDHLYNLRLRSLNIITDGDTLGSLNFPAVEGNFVPNFSPLVGKYKLPGYRRENKIVLFMGSKLCLIDLPIIH